ncbi:tyrosine-type recombinase/integrase [Zoogloea sp.]|uniref:tyrosine-type recombinase/integrase n=1 Tax=Zoogloea sp. TaxID=49181 RepID=UPI0035B084B9
MSHSTKVSPTVVELAPSAPAARTSAEIIVLPTDKIGRKRIQRVAPLARACGTDAPDLKARAPRQTEKRVPDLPGVVEITYRSGKRKGRKVWFLRYRDPLTRNYTSIRLGEVGVMSYIEMAALAKRYQDDVAAGRSPKSGLMTLKTFVLLHFHPWVLQHQRSSKDTMARLKRYVLPLLGDKPLQKIDRRDGERLVKHLLDGDPSMRFGELNPATINRVLMAALRALGYAVEVGFIAENPFKGIRKLKESPPSPRALDADELDRFLAALADEPLLFVLLIKFLLATAGRINEILALQETDIDYANGVVHLRMTKAGEAQTLPLTTTVAAILETLAPLRRPGNPHLFPARTGAGHMVAPYKRLKKVLAAAGLDQAGFHLFRKTVATRAMELPGMDVLTVSKLLRHKSVRTLEVHYLATPKKRLRQAANDVGELLLASRKGGCA